MQVPIGADRPNAQEIEFNASFARVYGFLPNRYRDLPAAKVTPCCSAIQVGRGFPAIKGSATFLLTFALARYIFGVWYAKLTAACLQAVWWPQSG